MALSSKAKKYLEILLNSRIYGNELADKIDEGPNIVGVASSFDGSKKAAHTSSTLTVSCDTVGVAGNKTITGNGTDTCAILIGAGYTITAGGSNVLEDGTSINIAGGIDDVPAVAAQFDGQVAGMTTDVTIDADVAGVAGNVTLTADSITDIDGLIAAHNLAFPANTLTLSVGDGSQVPTADIVLSGGANLVPGTAASYNGAMFVEGEVFTLTVVCDTTGVAGDVTITGNGTDTCATLIGAGYTISAGGTKILASGVDVDIAGGVDEFTKTDLSKEAKRRLEVGLANRSVAEEIVDTVVNGSAVLSAKAKRVLVVALASNSVAEEVADAMDACV